MNARQGSQNQVARPRWQPSTLRAFHRQTTPSGRGGFPGRAVAVVIAVVAGIALLTPGVASAVSAQLGTARGVHDKHYHYLPFRCHYTCGATASITSTSFTTDTAGNITLTVPWSAKFRFCYLDSDANVTFTVSINQSTKASAYYRCTSTSGCDRSGTMQFTLNQTQLGSKTYTAIISVAVDGYSDCSSSDMKTITITRPSGLTGDLPAVSLGGSEDLPVPGEIQSGDGTSLDTPGRIDPASDRAPMLSQNMPNPFSARTRIAFRLPSEGIVRLEILDVAGRVVRTLVDAHQPAGEQWIEWDGRTEGGQRIPAGIYFSRLRVNGSAESRRMVLVG